MPPTIDTVKRKARRLHPVQLGLCAVTALVIETSSAAAVSSSVRFACFSDYIANCSAHSVGTAELRDCMRAVGSRLSKRCIDALVTAGEVSQAEVKRRATAER